MARRRRGTPIHGWLIIDKPAGPSSAAMVARVRRALDARKAGHAGTLDPPATGVLAIALGEATKTVPFVVDAAKTYRFTVRWGAATDTDDAEGTVIATSDARPDETEIRAALPAFTGAIAQVPPQVSAVKVAGARAYALARAGEAPVLTARALTVDRLELIACPDRDTAELEMVCGKGGYVRAIARDLGAALGCFGHVLALRRLRAGPFDISAALDAESLEHLAGTGVLADRLLPLDAALKGLPTLDCPPPAAEAIAHGNPVALPGPGLPEDTRVLARGDGRPLALGLWRAGRFHPDRVFVLD
jgi:tRNA pseudouridine55 synthase